MTDEVGHLVLRDNYEQNIAARQRPACTAHSMLRCTSGFIRSLEAPARSTARSSSCPPTPRSTRATRSRRGADLAGVRRAGGLREDHAHRRPARVGSSPTSRTSRAPWAPTSRRSCAAVTHDGMPRHPLAREIITTVVVNDDGQPRRHHLRLPLREETGAGPTRSPRLHRGREVFGLEPCGRIEALDNEVPTAAQSALFLESRRLLLTGDPLVPAPAPRGCPSPKCSASSSRAWRHSASACRRCWSPRIAFPSRRRRPGSWSRVSRRSSRAASPAWMLSMRFSMRPRRPPRRGGLRGHRAALLRPGR